MNGLLEHSAHCPFCDAQLTLLIDTSAGADHSYTEDCHVCCQPILIHLHQDSDGHWDISLEQE
ncbi:CPXCG motif-containing cysteine-rich protein [Gilvimarinus agarilyticus]|uniref:CPXCG motif-containing cysteine-rich protein n=1 Tax=unclassified Gilvimarinus TaxID=2642066 RepID=UPI001C0A43EB|nr:MULTISPECIES: CPXCG motif-containing cysteine-rich protein [unclassified Gilvimarinus]MBU2884422.1 CPXCG motif-containing cysteine-rich protein [Gilvimarinus agarilyticus]MDO6569558.1 CPXCG motif-containing cysteine-rich protein [Gilvimarinus sp. 2_MG-2023]MDO6748117.1 CPXCG motif-containing cysteine-rich protein [Gilvimarinus sp. 1_MG-2023]